MALGRWYLLNALDVIRWGWVTLVWGVQGRNANVITRWARPAGFNAPLLFQQLCIIALHSRISGSV